MANAEGVRHRVRVWFVAVDVAAACLLVSGGAVANPRSSDDSLAVLEQELSNHPNDAGVAARYCDALTRAGLQQKAIEACDRAVAIEPNPANLRATVAARVNAKTPPTPKQLIESMMVIRGMRRSAPRGVYTYAAECDLYEGLGDWPALVDCSERLATQYPTHEQTKRVALAVSQRLARWYQAGAWWALASSVLLALLHAGYRRLTVAKRRTLSCVATALCLAATVNPVSAYAEPTEQLTVGEPRADSVAPGDQISRFHIDPAHPEASIPPDSEKNRDPLQFGYLLMDLTDRAELASKSGDHQAAARYYQALARAVPDRAISYSKLCSEYQSLGDRANALAACRSALGLGGVTINDYVRFADLVLAAPGTLSAESVTELDRIVEHLTKEAGQQPYAAFVECKLGLRLQDRTRMAHCTEQLGLLAPRDL